MPAIIDGDLRVHTGETSNYLIGGDIPLVFSYKIFLRIYPLILGILFSYLLIVNNSLKYNSKTAIRIFSYSIFFVSSWGFLQYISFHINLPFPYSLFNTMPDEFMMGLNTEYGDYYDSYVRINSVTQEPSHMALHLASGLLIVFASQFISKTKSTLNKLFIIITIITLLLSTSTTAIFSIIIIIISSMFSLTY